MTANDTTRAGAQNPSARRTNGHTITGDGVIGASESEIDWQRAREVLGE